MKRVENYKKEWAKHEQNILCGLSDIAGLEFNRDVIDVYIVSVNPRQFSNPIIIKSGFPSDEFVDILTRLEKNILRSKKHTTNEYARAWEIVGLKGYKNLIEEFKNKLALHN